MFVVIVAAVKLMILNWLNGWLEKEVDCLVCVSKSRRANVQYVVQARTYVINY